jgi:hypothetical protein
MEHFSAFVPAILAGLGLFLAGAANIVLLRRRLVWRALATVAALGIALGTAAGFHSAEILGNTARVLAIGMVPFILLGSDRLIRALRAAFVMAGRPLVRCTLLTVAGIGLAIGSIAALDRAEREPADIDPAEFQNVRGRAQTTPSLREKGLTDRGTSITLQEAASPRDAQLLADIEEQVLTAASLRDSVIRVGPANDRCNCHGWVFTGGRYSVRGGEVDVILHDNNYQEQSQPKPGDLVVYRAAEGTVRHTAVVQYITEGEPVLVKGKWGNFGIFTHPVDQSPYGVEFTFYRSPRAGHLISIVPNSRNELPPTVVTE